MAIFEKLPYTNYHDLNADWIVKKVKEVADAWTEYRDDMDEWKTGVDTELQTFYDWFDNLDLTDEVRTIIEEMVQDGSFITTATPVITSATEDWLAAHVSQGYAVDNTLTISGAAADAKVTGDRITQLKEDLTAIAIRSTASGWMASFNDGAEAVPMKSLVVNIEPVQSGTGDPSPSNVRPITGWAGVNTVRCGVNIWDEEWEVGAIDANTGENTSSSNNIRSKNYIPVLPVSYYFKGVSNIIVIAYDESHSFVERLRYGSPNFTFTPTERVKYIRFCTYGSYGATYRNDFSVNYPSSDTDYHAYEGDTYTTALEQTVYGGTLDVVSGELVIDRAIVDLGTLNWSTGTDSIGQYFNASLSGAKPAASASTIANIICTQYKATSSNNVQDKNIALSSGGSATIYIRDTDYATAAAFTTAMSGVYLVYEVTTPTTVQLTAQEVTTLQGANNVFADAGSVNVTYLADGKLYIDNRIAELQALILEQ